MENKKFTRDDITINNHQATYIFRHEGAIAGTYTGQFVFRCFLLPSQRLAASRDRRNLLGEFGVLASNLDKDIALALTELKQRIISAPPFWYHGKVEGDIPDTDLIINVFNAAMDAEEIFKQMKAEEKAKLLESAQKAAEAILAQKKAEEKDEKKSDEEELEDELKEMDNES